MKFIVNTKPLSDSLDLGVINANVSKFYRKSCLAQVTADKTTLKVNLEAANILSEIVLRGCGDADTTVSVFVDSLLFKQLVSTLDSSTVTLEFAEGGLILHSGKSKFTLPKILDGVELDLNKPSLVDYNTDKITIDKSDWKFIKENQMYAIAMSFVHPVYTKVWAGNEGDVIVGDFDNSLFTHSKKSKLGSTCLLTDTIINLFNSLPEGATLVKHDRNYIIHVSTDTYTYTAEFTPQYESDEGVGNYHANIILDMMKKNGFNPNKISASAVSKFLGQASLLSSSTEDVITFSIENGKLTLKDNNVDCSISVGGDEGNAYSVDFKTVLLKSVMSTYASDESIDVIPIVSQDEISGIVLWNNELTTVLAGVD